MMSVLARLLVAARRRLLAMSPVPRIGVRMLAVTPGNEVLLVRHTHMPGWGLPGGALDTGETAAEGAMRETLEETGCIVRSVDGLLGLYANFSVGWSDHVAVFHSRDVEIPGHFPARPPSWLEIAETGLFPLDALPDDISQPTRRRLAEWRGDQPVAPDW